MLTCATAPTLDMGDCTLRRLPFSWYPCRPRRASLAAWASAKVTIIVSSSSQQPVKRLATGPKRCRCQSIQVKGR